MPPQLQWTASTAASLLHMASMWCQGAEIVDARIRAVLETSIAPIRDRLTSEGDALWSQCFATLATDSNTLRWLAPPLLDPFLELGQAIESVLPDFDQQVASRQRPLRDAWESRGPGILSVLAKRGICASPQAHVVLVQPVVGGYGRVIASGQLIMEAMLVNSIPRLPEVVRLAWLVAQTNMDNKTELDRLALITAVVEAAAEVELVQPDEAIQLALKHWSLPSDVS